MVYIKRISLAVVAVVMVGVTIGTIAPLSAPVYADDKTQKDSETDVEKKEPTDEQLTAIVQNCGNIKQSLVKLQHSDSRTRTYLGSAYEAISGRFITPLNLRLVKSGKPTAELFQIQSDFTDAQTNFRDGYVAYMREMEALSAVDCTAHPKEFYTKLEEVRSKREELRVETERLSKIAQAQYQAVDKLRGEL